MRKKTLLVLGLAVMSLSISAARAEIGLSAELGTTGVGIHASVPVFDNLNARFGVNAFNYSYNGRASQVNYDFKLKLQTFDLLADYYPFDNGFRVTGGLIYNGNKISASGRPANASYTLNGRTYTTENIGSLEGNVNFRKTAPYAGLGWGNAVAKDSNWSFTADAGVLFQGSASASLVNARCTAEAAICTRLADDVAVERQKLDDKVSSYRFYPVIRAGLTYKF